MSANTLFQFCLRVLYEKWRTYRTIFSMKSGTVRNARSARVSMPSQITALSSSSSSQQPPESNTNNEDIIEEEDTETGENGTSGVSNEPNNLESEAGYGWRIDLMKSEPYWRGWFQGLSQKFLDVHAPKMLLLAGVDR